MNYELVYNKMIDELKAVPDISIIKSDFFIKDELLPGFLEKNKSLTGIKEELKILNDNYFLWSFRSGKNKEWFPMGEFHLLAAEELMKKSKNEQLFSSGASINLKGDVYPFDDHPDGGDGMMGCFVIENDSPQIWLHSENGEMFRMELDLKEYFIKIVELKAIYGWQYLFAEINLKQPVFATVKSDLNNRLTILKKNFPDSNYDKYLIK